MGTRSALALVLAPLLCGLTPSRATAQKASPFLFSVAAPEPTGAIGENTSTPSIGDRALTLWTGAAFDPGVGVEARAPAHLIVRTMKGAVNLVSGGLAYSHFQQVEVLRSFGRVRGVDMAAGGGFRQEFDGTQTIIGRVVAGAPVLRGRLETNTVFEKAMAVRRDRVDVVTTFGWSRSITHLLSAGIEGIGQDLEGFWSREESEGGARLLVGPSVHLTLPDRRWSLTVAGGPLFQSNPSAALATDAPRSISGLVTSRGHYAVLGSFTCVLRPAP